LKKHNLKDLFTRKRIKISELSFNTGQVPGLPKNPRFIRDQKFEAMCQSIREDPEYLEVREVLIYDYQGVNVVIAGEMRTRGAKNEGHKDVQCKIFPESTPIEKVRAYAIKDNAHYGEWDQDALANDWEAGELKEWGVDEASWGEGDNSLNSAKAEEDDYEEPEIETIKTDIVLGDLFEIGEHRLLCGDSTKSEDIERLMNGKKANIIFTDPDYSMEEDALFRCYDNIKNLGQKVSFFVCADKQAVKLASRNIDDFSSFFIHDFKVPTLISNTRAMQRHNMVCVFGNSSIKNRMDGFTTIVSVATERTLESHKTVRMAKRIALPAAFIEHYTDEGDIVVDIFIHSASTVVACQQLKRVCFGIEIEPRYCQVSIDRILKDSPDLKITKNGKEYRQETL